MEPVSFFYRPVKRIKFDDFQRDLEQLPLECMFYMPNIDDKLGFFNDCILGLFDHQAPLKQFRKNKNYKYAPWITENIKLLQKLRNIVLKNTSTQHCQLIMSIINNYETTRRLQYGQKKRYI